MAKQSQKRAPGDVFRDTFLPVRKQWRVMTYNGLWPEAFKTQAAAVRLRDAALAMFAPVAQA